MGGITEIFLSFRALFLGLTKNSVVKEVTVDISKNEVIYPVIMKLKIHGVFVMV